MAYLFGDSFDFYTAVADAAGYWDSASVSGNLQTGRFSNSQAIGLATNTALNYLTKSSGSNDATHHIVCSFVQTIAWTGSGSGFVLTLFDGATAQCSIVFRSDGVILLTAGLYSGSVLATYSNAFLPNVWQSFEFEVTINNTTGAFHVRKDGATSDAFVATSLNTRGSANNYANKLQVGIGSWTGLGTGQQRMDDLLWFNTSGAAPNTWVGDVRAYQLMPVSDSSVQFAKSPNPSSVTPYSSAGTLSKTTGAGIMGWFTASYTGTISSAVLQVTTGGTGNLKAAIYDATRSTVLATSNAVVNPVAGANAITFGTPLSVTKGTIYWFAVDTDFTIVYNAGSGANTSATFTTAYGSFPATGPTTALSSQPPIFTISIVPTVNAEFVNEVLQDGTTSYVYDATVGHADLYDIADLPANTSSIVALTTRAYMQKSDAGARTGRVQLKSGGTTVTGDLVLSSSFSWCSRTDTVDPNTSSAWTLSNANAAQAGLVVAA